MLKIITSDKTYEVNDSNQIAQLGFSFSGHWFLAGGIRYNNFGQVVEHFNVDQLTNSNLAFYYKNGKPRIFIIDIDYGTTRVWSCGATVHNWG